MEFPCRISICGFADLAGQRQSQISHVLSLLDPGVPVPPDLDDFPPHHRLVLRFHDIIDEQPGMDLPCPEHITQLLKFTELLLEEARSGKHLLVHCHAGFSRSPASAILSMARLRPEIPAARLMTVLLLLRPRIWPNLRVLEIGDALLGRRGEIVDAAHQLYRKLLERDPSLHRLISEVGRGRELQVVEASSMSTSSGNASSC
jgi:predicted protein tyrosine phosphatase